MFFAVVFGLAALAAADPDAQQQIQLEQPVQVQQQIQLEQPVQVQQQPIQHEMKQQQMAENPTFIPLYEQVTDGTPLSESRKQLRYSPFLEEMKENFPSPLTQDLSDLRNQRYFPYYKEMKENYPYLPYNYENTMTYPYRSNYFLRHMNKPEMGMQQPKVDYDSQDIYHLHDVNHHHMINNIHEFKQKEINRKLNEMDYPYIPYSPMYNDKYMYKFYNRGYPYENKYYGKSLEQEYVQPWTTKYYNRYWDTDYNRYWDTDYIRNYYGNLNSEATRPFAYRNSDNPFLYRKMYSDSEQPISSEDLNIEFTKNARNFNIENIPMRTMNPFNMGYPYGKNQFHKSLEHEYIRPWTNRIWDMDFIRNYYGNFNSEITRPYTYRTLDKPFLYRKMNSGSEQPISSKDLNIEFTKNARNFNIENIPMRTMNPFNIGYPYGKNQFHKSLEHEYIWPWTNRIWDMDYIRNYYGNFNSEITRPYTYRTFDKPFLYRKVNYVTPESLGDAQHFTSRSLNVEQFKPTISTNLKFNYIYPFTSKSQGPNYVHPVAPNSHGVNYIHPIMDSDEMPLDYIPIEGQFKRNLDTQVGAHAELNPETPLIALQHNPATNVELSRHTPVVSEHHEVAAQELVSQEGRRPIQVNTNTNAEATLKSEDHISQQPIHRQARDTTVQTLEDFPQYPFYPHYLHPFYRTYLPVQPTPLVTRSALYPYHPYYYDWLLRK